MLAHSEFGAALSGKTVVIRPHSPLTRFFVKTPTPPIRFVWTATEVAFRNEIRLATGYAGNLLTEAVA